MMQKIISLLIGIVLIPLVNNGIYAQPGTNQWKKNITVRLHFELYTTYYGHDKEFYCDSIDPIHEPSSAGTGYNWNTFPYILDSLKIGEYTNIKFVQKDQITNILVKCNFKIDEKSALYTHMYLINELPEGGYYFINLDTLKEYSTEKLYNLTEMDDITPENWGNYKITKERYNQLITDSKQCFLRKLFTKPKRD